MILAPLLLSIGVGAFIDGPARPAPVAISGTVVDADRNPAAGAGVYFSSWNTGHGWGVVDAQAETDAHGRFRLEVPGDPGRVRAGGVLWAYRPGALVASRRVTRELLPPDLPVVMVLDHPARSEFLIRGPGGQPVAGARIEPRLLHRDDNFVPAGLAERIAARTFTDARGRAVLSAFFPEEVRVVFVKAPGLGSQHFDCDRRDDDLGVMAIDLVPVGRVEGRITPGDAEMIINNRELTVFVRDRRGGSLALGVFYLRTDPRGRFAIPEVPVGRLVANGTPTAGSPWYLQATSRLEVEARRTTWVEVKAIKGVRLRGVVRERGTGIPIAGVGVVVSRAGVGEDDVVRTDTEGRFELFAQPGRPQVSAWSVPEGFARSHFAMEVPNIPEGALAAAVPPIELSRADKVRGVVVDDRGQPVAGVNVQASNATFALSGRQGEFLIDRVVADVTAELWATAPDGRQTAQPVAAQAGGKAVTLALGAFSSVSMAGRVVDSRGERVAGARVRLRVQYRMPPMQPRSYPVEIRGASVILTRADGWFRTPPVLDPALEYAAIVEADGFEPSRTAWTAAGARTFPGLVLRARGLGSTGR